MILTDAQIRAAHNAGDIIIEPFEDKQLQPATYDLRVGAQGATTTTKKLIDIQREGYLLLKPGDFAIITVLEILRLSPEWHEDKLMRFS